MGRLAGLQLAAAGLEGTFHPPPAETLLMASGTRRPHAFLLHGPQRSP